MSLVTLLVQVLAPVAALGHVLPPASWAAAESVGCLAGTQEEACPAASSVAAAAPLSKVRGTGGPSLLQPLAPRLHRVAATVADASNDASREEVSMADLWAAGEASAAVRAGNSYEPVLDIIGHHQHPSDASLSTASDLPHTNGREDALTGDPAAEAQPASPSAVKGAVEASHFVLQTRSRLHVAAARLREWARSHSWRGDDDEAGGLNEVVGLLSLLMVCMGGALLASWLARDPSSRGSSIRDRRRGPRWTRELAAPAAPAPLMPLAAPRRPSPPPPPPPQETGRRQFSPAASRSAGHAAAAPPQQAKRFLPQMIVPTSQQGCILIVPFRQSLEVGTVDIASPDGEVCFQASLASNRALSLSGLGEESDRLVFSSASGDVLATCYREVDATRGPEFYITHADGFVHAVVRSSTGGEQHTLEAANGEQGLTLREASFGQQRRLTDRSGAVVATTQPVTGEPALVGSYRLQVVAGANSGLILCFLLCIDHLARMPGRSPTASTAGGSSPSPRAGVQGGSRATFAAC